MVVLNFDDSWFQETHGKHKLGLFLFFFCSLYLISNLTKENSHLYCRDVKLLFLLRFKRETLKLNIPSCLWKIFSIGKNCSTFGNWKMPTYHHFDERTRSLSAINQSTKELGNSILTPKLLVKDSNLNCQP